MLQRLHYGVALLQEPHVHSCGMRNGLWRARAQTAVPAMTLPIFRHVLKQLTGRVVVGRTAAPGTWGCCRHAFQDNNCRRVLTVWCDLSTWAGQAVEPEFLRQAHGKPQQRSVPHHAHTHTRTHAHAHTRTHNRRRRHRRRHRRCKRCTAQHVLARSTQFQ